MTLLACTMCHRDLRDDEPQTCRPCAERVDTALLALAGPDGLYARLTTRLAPGAGSGQPSVSGSRTAPLPVRLEPLSMLARGGVVTILQTWLCDWHEQLGWGHPRWTGGLQQQLDQVVRALRTNIPWAADSHPAFSEFAAEAGDIRRQCERVITGERPERRITVACADCSSPLSITLSTEGRRCGCGRQYGWAELRELPLAERRAA